MKNEVFFIEFVIGSIRVQIIINCSEQDAEDCLALPRFGSQVPSANKKAFVSKKHYSSEKIRLTKVQVTIIYERVKIALTKRTNFFT